jgi:hypothetical protein
VYRPSELHSFLFENEITERRNQRGAGLPVRTGEVEAKSLAVESVEAHPLASASSKMTKGERMSHALGSYGSYPLFPGMMPVEFSQAM